MFKTNNNDASSTLTANAKLIAKNIFFNSIDRSLHSVYVVQTNLLTFELENSRRIVLEVSPFIYASLIENDVGILTYKENGQSVVFENFQLQLMPSQDTP